MVVSNIFYLYHYLGEMIQFDEHIFSGGLKPPTSNDFKVVFVSPTEKFWQSSRGQKGEAKGWDDFLLDFCFFFS